MTTSLSKFEKRFTFLKLQHETVHFCRQSVCPTEHVFHGLFRERASLTHSHYRGCHVHLKPLQSVNVDGVCLRSSLPSQSGCVSYSSLTLISLHHLCQHVSVIVRSGFSTGEVCVCVCHVSCACVEWLLSAALESVVSHRRVVF